MYAATHECAISVALDVGQDPAATPRADTGREAGFGNGFKAHSRKEPTGGIASCREGDAYRWVPCEPYNDAGAWGWNRMESQSTALVLVDPGSLPQGKRFRACISARIRLWWLAGQ